MSPRGPMIFSRNLRVILAWTPRFLGENDGAQRVPFVVVGFFFAMARKSVSSEIYQKNIWKNLLVKTQTFSRFLRGFKITPIANTDLDREISYVLVPSDTASYEVRAEKVRILVALRRLSK